MLTRKLFSSRFFRNASNFRPVKPPPPVSPNKILAKILEDKDIQSPQDWKSVRSEILNNGKLFTPGNIDALTVNVCTVQKKYDMAFSYLDFLKEENIELNLATIGQYFRLLYQKGVYASLSQEDEKKILTMYETLRKSHPVLDSLTLENVVQAISLTKDWKICFKLLDEIKLSSTPTSYAYSAVAAAAFSNNLQVLGWELLDELLAKNKSILGNVYESYFKKVAKESDKIQGVERMFEFIQRNSLKVELDGFVKALGSLNLSVLSARVDRGGVCKVCNNKLKSFEPTESEFNELKTNIVQNVIVGKDVFNRSTSEELTLFRNFISNLKRFDVIIDGLNVAYSAGVYQSPQITSGLLSAVVSHFSRSGKKVLVLGRHHMSRWPNWNYIKQNATTFLTQNLSQDDPYLLYCALHSGKDTIIVTRDLMRGHKFLLSEVRLKLLFERWLTQRQYILLRVQEQGAPIFKKPLPFSLIAQKSGRFWHIPCGVPPARTDWLCVKV